MAQSPGLMHLGSSGSVGRLCCFWLQELPSTASLACADSEAYCTVVLLLAGDPAPADCQLVCHVGCWPHHLLGSAQEGAAACQAGGFRAGELLDSVCIVPCNSNSPQCCHGGGRSAACQGQPFPDHVVSHGHVVLDGAAPTTCWR